MKKLLVSGLTGNIYYTNARENALGLTIGYGEKKEMTDEAVKAVFQHMSAQALMANKKVFEYTISGWGKLTFEREENS